MSLTGTDAQGNNFTVSVGLQEDIISANVNSVIVSTFLMGIYTLVYFGAVYSYFSNTGQNLQRRLVLSTITVLYILCTCLFGLELYFLRWSIIDNGATRGLTVIASSSPPIWLSITQIVLQNIMIFIADGLLLWRCFHLWNRSWRVISIPLMLTISELALLIVEAYIDAHGDPASFNNLFSAFMFISAGSTVITTTLIGYRLYGSTSCLIGSKSKRHFRDILHVLIQSAALYAFVVLLNAIFTVIPSANSFKSSLSDVGFYLGAILPISAVIRMLQL